MKTIKVIVLTLSLGLAGYVYAADGMQASTDCSKSDKASAACCKAEASHCKASPDCCKSWESCCGQDAECCKSGSACCASDAKCCEATAKDNSKTAPACCGSACKKATHDKN